MTETVIVELDKYLEYKKYYDYVQSQNYTNNIYEKALRDKTYEIDQLRGKLETIAFEAECKLTLYNKAKNGTFVDKLIFLFSKE